MKKQSCRTCKHLEVWPDKSGRRVPRTGYVYECKWPAPKLTLPDSITTGTRQVDADLFGRRRRMEPDDGENCPCWEPRP